MSDEQTFVLAKPDAIKRGLLHVIIEAFEKKGYKLVAIKTLRSVPIYVAENHYEEHKGKPFYENLIKFTTSGPVVAMIWEGNNVITYTREFIVGKRQGSGWTPGTVRGDYCGSLGPENLIHASDSKEAVWKESQIWFS
jgi:nucleoside-diphosphate kinase